MNSPVTSTDARLQVMERAVEQIADALVKIARLEERHQETREALARDRFELNEIRDREKDTAIRLTRTEERVKVLEESRGWLVKGLLGVVGLVGVALASLVVIGK